MVEYTREDLKDYKWDRSKFHTPKPYNGECGGRTDGFGGFTCVDCGLHYERDEVVNKCEGK